MQLRYFFGGDALVQSTAGMSYAEYARRGFFELVTVSALVLPVLLSANALLRRDTPLAAASIATLASTLLVAARRHHVLGHRAHAPVSVGLRAQHRSPVRDGVHGVARAGVCLVRRNRASRREKQFFTAGVLVSGWGTLIALNAADPAGYVARFNIARGQQGKEVDVQYIASLGADAAPALASYLVRQPLTAPTGWVAPTANPGNTATTETPNVAPPAAAPAYVATADDFTHRCQAARRLLSDWGATSYDWRSWSVARGKAQRAVRAKEAALRQVAGQEIVDGRYVACAVAPSVAPK